MQKKFRWILFIIFIYNFTQTYAFLEDNLINSENHITIEHKIKVVVIMAEPSDLDFDETHDKTYFETEILPDIKDYWCEQSFGTRDENGVCSGGLVDLEFEVFNNRGQNYKLSKTNLYYGEGDVNTEKSLEFLNETSTISNIVPNDGNQDVIIVVHSGERDKGTEETQMNMGTLAYGNKFIALVAEKDPIYAWLHEIGHIVGNLKVKKTLCDLYDEAKGCNAYGGNIKKWALMGKYLDGSVALTSFSKKHLNWFGESLIGKGDHQVEALSTMQYGDNIKRYNINDKSYYLLETRTKDTRFSEWDSKAIPESALLTYQVRNDVVGDIPFIEKVNAENLFTLDNPFRSLWNNVKIDAYATESNEIGAEEKFFYSKVDIGNALSSQIPTKGASLLPSHKILNQIWDKNPEVFYQMIGPDDVPMVAFNAFDSIKKETQELEIYLILIIFSFGVFIYFIYKRKKYFAWGIFILVFILSLIFYSKASDIEYVYENIWYDIQLKFGLEKQDSNFRWIKERDMREKEEIEKRTKQYLESKNLPIDKKRLNQIQDENYAYFLPNDESFSPDLDLHAITPDGMHTGMNYETEEYENNIPNAETSGDLLYNEEWIFVPEETDVEFYVSSHDIEEYLDENPEVLDKLESTEEGYTLQAVKYDSDGVRYESPILENETIAPGIENPYIFSGSGSTIEIIPEEGNQAKIKANIWLEKKRFNMRGGHRRFMKAFIELPEGFDVEDIDLSTVKMVINGKRVRANQQNIKIGDRNKNGIPDVMVKFNRARIKKIVKKGINRVKIRGKIDGQIFRGHTKLKVIKKRW